MAMAVVGVQSNSNSNSNGNGSIGDNNKPHAVCIAYPAQSHLKRMMKLAKLLHHKGFYLTFVNTEFNQNHLIKAKGPDSLNSFSNFQFKTIADSLPPFDPDATQDPLERTC
ncbi:hypothetical protein CsSME_00014473 [Camellia sinensis var. sinensis]